MDQRRHLYNYYLEHLMHEPPKRRLGTPFSQKEAEDHLRLQRMLLEFSRLFEYDEPNDRAIAVVGPAFLDTLITQVLTNFLVEDAKEVEKLLQPEGHLGTFGARVSICYCLGLIGKTVTDDLRTVAKIRNRFAHDLLANFSDPKISSWCNSLRWHRVSMMCEPPSDATARDLFQVGVNQLVCHLNALPGLALFHKRQISRDG